MNLKVLKISATITKLHPSHTQDIKKKKVKLCSNKVLLAKTSGGLICLTYLHWTLHFKLSKNLLTAVSIIGPIIIFIFHFIFWNNFHNFIYKNRKENVDKEKVTFSYSLLLWCNISCVVEITSHIFLDLPEMCQG